ncbi:MAG: hypothetical protein AAB544_03765 [Patescibacteria group bacterium]
MVFKPNQTERGSDGPIVSWQDSRLSVSREMRELVDAVLAHGARDDERHRRLQTSLLAMTSALATELERECAEIRFCMNAMIKPGEASSHECAMRLLQMLPEFHALMGSAFTSHLPVERREALVALGMTSPEQWLPLVRQRLIALLREIDRI